MSSTQTFQELANEIISLRGAHAQKIVGIDGGGGAGKSTFAKHLQELIPNAVVIHGDDFYKGPWDKRLDRTDYVVNPMFDWDRYKREVLDAVRDGKLVQYHVYDWHKHSAEEIVSVPQYAIIIVEGGYVTQKDFADSYDFKIWIDADMDFRLNKALERDGEHMRYLWEEDWLPVERNYVTKDNPALRADLVVKGHSGDFAKGVFEISL